MYNSILLTAALAAAALSPSVSQQTALQLKEASLRLEYSAIANVAVAQLEAEREQPLSRLELRAPSGQLMFDLRCAQGQLMHFADLVLETYERGPVPVLKAFPEGLYGVRGRTLDGALVLGDALLSHDLLPAPIVLEPKQGASGVPRSSLRVSWVPDPGAAGYRVILEQDENDGLKVALPPGTSEFLVPDRFLAPESETKLEVGVVSPSGNCTLTEVTFTTQ